MEKRESAKLEELKNTVNDMFSSKLISEDDLNSITARADDLLHDLGCSGGGTVKVTCAGIYNSGKSSVLNALTNGQHFKVGDIPTTSTIDEFEYDGLVYVDTPGLNANDLDTETAQRAFKDATVILFVSNMISGGLTSAEADYLKQLSEILGGVENLRKQVVFAMSNVHQISEGAIDRIVNEHKSNIKSVFGFEPDKVIVYDAVTYENGVQSNSAELIESSGIENLKNTISEVVDAVSRQSGNILGERLSAKRSALSESLKNAVAPIEKNLEKLKTQSQEKAVDPQVINSAIEECKKIVETAKQEIKIPEFSCSEISGWDLLSKNTYVHGCSSEYEVKSKMKDFCQRAYDHRERVLKEKADIFSGNLDNLIGNNEFCKKISDTTSKAILDCNELLKNAGVVLPVALIEPVDVTFPTLAFDKYAVWQEVCEDVVEYGGYYNVSQYLDMYCEDVNEFERYTGTGAFGRMKYKKEYSCDCAKSIREMAKDMNGSYEGNCRRIWNRYFPEKASAKTAPENYSEYCETVKSVLGQRLDSMIKEAKTTLKLANSSSEKQIKRLQWALNAVKEFVD